MKKKLLVITLLPTLYLSGCAAPVLMGAAAAGAVAVTQDERSAGTIASDESLEIKAGNILNQDPTFADNSHLNVTCINGVVLLTGETQDSATLQNGIAQIRKLDKVREVRNEVTNSAPSSLESRSQDSWITTKIKSRLVGEKDIRANRFKVVTERQTVYLMGMVSKREGYVAATISREIAGVKRVVKIFEYTG